LSGEVFFDTAKGKDGKEKRTVLHKKDTQKGKKLRVKTERNFLNVKKWIRRGRNRARHGNRNSVANKVEKKDRKEKQEGSEVRRREKAKMKKKGKQPLPPGFMGGPRMGPVRKGKRGEK